MMLPMMHLLVYNEIYDINNAGKIFLVVYDKGRKVKIKVRLKL